MKKEKISALVVTFNRKQLLVECLEALLKQTYTLDAVYIIDNASTDGTPEFLIEKGFVDKVIYNDKEIVEAVKYIPITNFSDRVVEIHYVRLNENTGGAGGFYEAIKRAYEKGYEWLWLMDDDTIPDKNALKELLSAYVQFKETEKPVLLCSKVVWVDGTLHPMNIANPKKDRSNADFFKTKRKTFRYDSLASFLLSRRMEIIKQAEDRSSLVSIRYASFVSLLLHRNAVKQFGFPIKNYFIWNDDVEYTARILKKSFGVLVPSSVVVHKTTIKHTPLDACGLKVYYEIRNKLWLIIYSNALTIGEKIKVLVYLFLLPFYLIPKCTIKEIVDKKKIDWLTCLGILRGFKDGLFKKN